MNIFRIIGAEERERFDAFVLEARGHPYQSFGWGEADRARGWHPVRAVLEDRSRLIATVAALCKPLSRWCMMDATLGPVADFSSDETARRVIRAMKAFARRSGALYLRINPDVETRESLARILAEDGFRPARTAWRYRATLRISLADPLESILAGMEPETRRLIRRAERNGVQVSAGDDERDVDDLLALYRETCRRKNLSGRSERHIRALCAQGGLTRLFVARSNGAPCSALLVSASAGRMVHVISCCRRPSPREVGRYLRWCAMRWGKEHGFVEYDMGGIPWNARPGDDQWGVYVFKRGFGGRRVELIGEYERCMFPVVTPLFARLLDGRSRLKRRLAPAGAEDG